MSNHQRIYWVFLNSLFRIRKKSPPCWPFVRGIHRSPVILIYTNTNFSTNGPIRRNYNQSSKMLYKKNQCCTQKNTHLCMIALFGHKVPPLGWAPWICCWEILPLRCHLWGEILYVGVLFNMHSLMALQNISEMLQNFLENEFQHSYNFISYIIINFQCSVRKLYTKKKNIQGKRGQLTQWLNQWICFDTEVSILMTKSLNMFLHRIKPRDQVFDA